MEASDEHMGEGGAEVPGERRDGVSRAGKTGKTPAPASVASPLAPRRVLITGGAGFIGGHLAESFRQEAAVRVLDDFRSGSRRFAGELSHGASGGPGVEMVEGSILNEGLLWAAMQGVDMVFHLAAVVGVAASMEDPAECHAVNATGTLRVLEAAAAVGVRKVFFASSAAVYGNNPATMPTTEQSPPEPESPYAITKLLGEHYGRFFTQSGRVRTVGLRFFNVFGPRQNPCGPYAAAVAGFIAKALAGEPLVIYGDGGQTRDFIYVKDIVRAIRNVTLREEITGVYNAGCGRSIGIRKLAERIRDLTGSGSEIVHRPARPGETRHSCATMEALAESGFRKPEGFDDGLRETIASYRESRPIGD